MVTRVIIIYDETKSATTIEKPCCLTKDRKNRRVIVTHLLRINTRYALPSTVQHGELFLVDDMIVMISSYYSVQSVLVVLSCLLNIEPHIHIMIVMISSYYSIQSVLVVLSCLLNIEPHIATDPTNKHTFKAPVLVLNVVSQSPSLEVYIDVMCLMYLHFITTLTFHIKCDVV